MPSINVFSFVSKELRRGKVIDADVWSRTLAPLFLELTFKEIEGEVLKAIEKHSVRVNGGGVADPAKRATTEQPEMPSDPSGFYLRKQKSG